MPGKEIIFVAPGCPKVNKRVKLKLIKQMNRNKSNPVIKHLEIFIKCLIN
jgi:hypothetical protein